ncbi:MAG TPA: class I SAM-dependent methyltransferase [Bacteroidia bacterium]|nr:class I SAM-dependent methyltransferase [Bacteroidia bacterium]
MNDILIIDPDTKAQLTKSSEGLLQNGLVKFPFKNGAYRLVSDSNYTENFGKEWNTFQTTQIDKHTGNNVSKVRLFAQTGWKENDFAGENILEVGSGAGRFTQILIDYTKANIFTVDYSNAVEANFRNNGPHERLNIFQGSIYDLPFAPKQFDKVICLGVLQHTPDFKNSVQCLCNMVKPGGQLVIDFYPIKGWYSKINAKYMLRPFVKNMDHQRMMKLIDKNVDWMISAHMFFKKIGVGKIVNRFIPVCDISTTVPKGLSKAQLREWVVLDTFDMMSPAFDNPQSLATVSQWLKEFGMEQIDASMVKFAEVFEAATIRCTQKQ